MTIRPPLFTASLFTASLFTLLLTACPPPTVVTPDPVPRPTGIDINCGEAGALMDDGRFAEAIDWLRQLSIDDPLASADARTDLCLARALIGDEQHDAALRLIAPLQRDASASDDVRAQACILGAWAALAAGRSDEADRHMADCEVDAWLDPSDVVRPSDGHAARVVLMETRGRRGDHLGALELGETLLDADPVTRQWAVDRAFEWAANIAGDELLALESNPTGRLGRAVASFSRLAEAGNARDWSAFDRLHAAIQSDLYSLGASSALLQAGEWSGLRDEAMSPVIGVVLPFSGEGRARGRAALAGLLLAQRSFDAGYESFSHLLIEDGGETTESARAAVAALDERGALAIIAPPQTALASAISLEASQRGIPVLSLGGVDSEAGWAFDFRADPGAEAAALIEFAVRERLTRLAVVQPIGAGEYLDGLTIHLADLGSRHGIEVAEPIFYVAEAVQAEMEAVASALARQPFDGLVFADHGGNATTLAAYLAVEDVWARAPGSVPSSSRREVIFLGNSTWNDPEFLASGPDYLSGGVFAAWLDAGEEGELFADSFEWVYGRRPGLLEAFAFDALTVLRMLALDDGFRTRPGLRDALSGLDGLLGATGIIRFDADRLRDLQPTLVRVTSAGFEPLR